MKKKIEIINDTTSNSINIEDSTKHQFLIGVIGLAATIGMNKLILVGYKKCIDLYAKTK